MSKETIILSEEEICRKLNLINPDEFTEQIINQNEQFKYEHYQFHGEVLDINRGTGRTTKMLVKALYQLQFDSIILAAHTLDYAYTLKREIMRMAELCGIDISKRKIGNLSYDYFKAGFISGRFKGKGNTIIFADHYCFEDR